MLTGLNHIAILTDDLDRLEAFYRDAFEVEDVHRMECRGLRHTLLRVGSRAILHAFEQPAPAPAPMFERGRLDHLALNVDSFEDFEVLRKRLVALGASTGEVTNFGALLSVNYRDPDGLDCELCWMVPGKELTDVVDPW